MMHKSIKVPALGGLGQSPHPAACHEHHRPQPVGSRGQVYEAGGMMKNQETSDYENCAENG
jgi:hypothetical protein